MNKPFKLKPVYKDYIWGGQKIIKELHKDTNINPCAEAWDFSCHSAGVSFCDSGEFKGKKINEIFKLHPEYLGKCANSKGDIPILIKFIDAREDLSIQVHPDDNYALKNENSLGKSEVWYILDSNDGHLRVGFNKDVNKEIVNEAIINGNICDYTNYFPVKKGDYYPIDAGTIHAICSGCLLIEVQENSDLTYRIFDYNRIDKEGNKRPLHIDKALDVLNYSKYNVLGSNSVDYSCNRFSLSIATSPIDIVISKDSFIVLICIEGNCVVECDGEQISLQYGESIFVPADSFIKIKGDAKFLKVIV